MAEKFGYLVLLIAPEGIEILIPHVFCIEGRRLLIAPEGIEILILKVSKLHPRTLNRTRRN